MPLTAEPRSVAAPLRDPLVAAPEAQEAPSNPIAAGELPFNVGETAAIKSAVNAAGPDLGFYLRLLAWGTLALAMLMLGQSALAFAQVRTMRRSFAGAQLVADVASAAARTAQFSTEAHQLSERAWMATKDPVWSYSSYVKDGLPTEGVFFILRWTNGGRTPAMNCTISIAQKAVRVNEGDTMPLFEPAAGTPQAGGPVAPGGVIAGGPFVIDADLLEQLRHKKVRVFFWALLRYNDAFREDLTRETESCVEVLHAGAVDNRDGKKMDRFELVARGPQNRAT